VVYKNKEKHSDAHQHRPSLSDSNDYFLESSMHLAYLARYLSASAIPEIVKVSGKLTASTIDSTSFL